MRYQETRGIISVELPSRREQLALFLRERGIARLTEIRRAGITAATVSRLEREGFVTNLGRGLYQLADATPEGDHSLAEAAKRVPKRRHLPCLSPGLARHHRSDAATHVDCHWP